MTALASQSIVRAGDWSTSVGTVTLDYDARLLRRKRLHLDDGRHLLVDLPAVTHLDDGDAFALDDGTVIAVRAADEPLLSVTGDLPRLAWL